jgi:hypothetical protein
MGDFAQGATSIDLIASWMARCGKPKHRLVIMLKHTYISKRSWLSDAISLGIIDADGLELF